MSSKQKASDVMEENKLALLPKLRFPEFREANGWKPLKLQKVSVPITERVGQKKLTAVSISAGIGFVPQAEKFGRDISGNQYQRYTLVKDGDFVFNKGNSLRFPQGCVYLLQGWGQVAAPSVFICFRLKEGYSNGFFQNCFEQNQHGNQLKKNITSGARSNGLLNISKETFFSVEIATPSLLEQQKIADCLSSLDELIATQSRKVDALKTHKKGLMQQLFPREGETQPRLRFPEFKSAGEWKEDTLESLCTAKISYGIVQAGPHISNGMPYIKSSDLNSELCLDTLSRTSDAIAQKYRRSEVTPGDLVFSLRGNIGVAQIVPKDIPVANLTQGTARIRTKGPSQFFLQALRCPSVHGKILAVSKGSTFQEISLEALRNIRLFHPSIAEQQRIASCLTSLDALITAHTQKLEALKTHKKGLMQQLFPTTEVVKA
ncbi:restriction endonuclease subunit S [Pseudomonas sp. S31]|uniref:restriction endonuclease subunit S n=1 Tax=Pseudomonas sp. S31 TaxID=1564473 RepID=UPI001913DF11|nr:restriction endonuclease subunit S [Pseudomonas sp. S31]MBK5002440.1 restriction endonuclease subunit S [Pseudomonas sp. S31]